ncbi:hypothetical protein GQ457_02G027020 [Hibiscus cannabinus]
MSETRLAQNSSSRGSSTKGENVGMERNLPRQVEPQVPVQPQEPFQPRNPEQHPEPVQAPPNPPDVQNVQRDCLLGMKEMFDQLLTNLKQDRPVAQVLAAPSRAPIEKLSQHRGYTFAGTIEEKQEEAEYWLERTTLIETTTLAAHAEKIMWSFFVEEFKKKYISEQYFNDRRNRFLHVKQSNKPIEQYVVELR